MITPYWITRLLIPVVGILIAVLTGATQAASNEGTSIKIRRSTPSRGFPFQIPRGGRAAPGWGTALREIAEDAQQAQRGDPDVRGAYEWLFGPELDTLEKVVPTEAFSLDFFAHIMIRDTLEDQVSWKTRGYARGVGGTQQRNEESSGSIAIACILAA